jgi:hypothetical protein
MAAILQKRSIEGALLHRGHSSVPCVARLGQGSGQRPAFTVIVGRRQLGGNENSGINVQTCW